MNRRIDTLTYTVYTYKFTHPEIQNHPRLPPCEPSDRHIQYTVYTYKCKHPEMQNLPPREPSRFCVDTHFHTVYTYIEVRKVAAPVDTRRAGCGSVYSWFVTRQCDTKNAIEGPWGKSADAFGTSALLDALTTTDADPTRPDRSRESNGLNNESWHRHTAPIWASPAAMPQVRARRNAKCEKVSRICEPVIHSFVARSPPTPTTRATRANDIDL